MPYKSRDLEPYGCQIIKRFHADSAGLAHEYDEFSEDTEDQDVKRFAKKMVIQHLKNLQDLACLWRKKKALWKDFEPPYALQDVDDEDMTDFDMEHSEEPSLRHRFPVGYTDAEEDQQDHPGLPGLKDHKDSGLGDGLDDILEPNPEYDLDKDPDHFPNDPQNALRDNRLDAGDIAEHFRKALTKAVDFLDALSQEGEEEDEDQDLQMPLQMKKRPVFGAERQHEAKRNAADLEEQTPRVKDDEVLETIEEAIALLRSIADTRSKVGSDEGLTPHEVMEAGRRAKSLRSILKGRKRGEPVHVDWNKGSRHGKKGLDVLLEDTKETAAQLKEMQSRLDSVVYEWSGDAAKDNWNFVTKLREKANETALNERLAEHEAKEREWSQGA